MKLGKKQELFSRLLGQLLVFIHAMGYQVRMGDVWARDDHEENKNLWEKFKRFLIKTIKPDTVFLKPRHSKGSVHPLKLAVDLNLFKDGKFLTKTEDHKLIGEYWKSLHDLCRWGGDFSRKDGNHYSLFHQGRK